MALEYAEGYPQNVEALVLDSVVLSTGPEPFALATFHAIPGVLNELCEDDACAGITTNPVGDLARPAQFAHDALGGSVYDGSGDGDVTLDEPLLQILVAGDLTRRCGRCAGGDRLALHHDPIRCCAEGALGRANPHRASKPPQEGSSSIDETLYLDTRAKRCSSPGSARPPRRRARRKRSPPCARSAQ